MTRKKQKEQVLEAQMDATQEQFWELLLQYIALSENDKEAQRKIQSVFEMALANIVNTAHFIEIEEMSFESGIELNEREDDDGGHLVEYQFAMECKDCNAGEAGYRLQNDGENEIEEFKGFKDMGGE